MPSPSLDVLLMAWRGVRLVRQVAQLYGVRPGTLGTLALLRRTMGAATTVGALEFAGNAAAHAVLSNPLLAHLAGEVAGAGIAARRMVVLARAAAAACDPLERASGAIGTARIQRRLQDVGGGHAVHDGGALAPGQVEFADQEAVDGGRRQPFIP